MDKRVFETSSQFREWLSENCLTGQGIWILFGKPGKKGAPKTMTAQEALEEALCFGWIDGQIKSIDGSSYQKYFAPRVAGSNWSAKNKKTVELLDKQGRMTVHGRNKIEQAKRGGSWDSPLPLAVTQEHIDSLAAMLSGHEPASSNFTAMSGSVKRTYAGFYYDARSEDTRRRRLERIIERLDKNLKPM